MPATKEVTAVRSFIDNVLFVYRISFCRVLDDSPFFLLHARDAVLPQDLTILPNRSKIEDKSDTDYKIKLLKTLRIAYEKLKNVKEKEQEN